MNKWIKTKKYSWKKPLYTNIHFAVMIVANPVEMMSRQIGESPKIICNEFSRSADALWRF